MTKLTINIAALMQGETECKVKADTIIFDPGKKISFCWHGKEVASMPLPLLKKGNSLIIADLEILLDVIIHN
jgi:hypothetical protein